MLKPVVNNYNFMVLVAAFCLCAVLAFVVMTDSKSLAAQNTENNFQELLHQINADDVTMRIRFIIPIVDSEPYWIIPTRSEIDGGAIIRSIGEIGNDYVCFNEVAGGARSTDCVPFTNIASISYDRSG